MTRRRRRSTGSEWLQASCSLFPGPAGEPFVPWADLAPAVAGWRSRGLFDRWSFLIKPPGIRLRFTGDKGAELQGELAGWLLAAERSNAVRGFRFTIYEPEEHRFGGPAGMALAHTHFDADSDRALRLHCDEVAAAARVRHSFYVMGDLMGRSVDDAAEVWDVWTRLRDAVGLAAGAAGSATREEVADGPGAQEHPATSAAIRSNEQIAGTLRSLAESGALTTGVRAWLTSLTVFHWNRLRLTTADLGPALDHLLAAGS